MTRLTFFDKPLVWLTNSNYKLHNKGEQQQIHNAKFQASETVPE